MSNSSHLTFLHETKGDGCNIYISPANAGIKEGSAIYDGSRGNPRVSNLSHFSGAKSVNVKIVALFRSKKCECGNFRKNQEQKV